MNEAELRDAAAALRRTATATRHSRQARWLETAMNLESLAAQREQEADALLVSA